MQGNGQVPEYLERAQLAGQHRIPHEVVILSVRRYSLRYLAVPGAQVMRMNSEAEVILGDCDDSHDENV